MNTTLEFLEKRVVSENKNAVRTEVKVVTPEIAKLWLTVNTMNRRIDKKVVDYYADQMIRDQWTLSQDAITFSNTNKLLNGQHRLHAIIKSQTEQPFIIVYNMTESAFINMDLNKRRSPGDIFQILNIKEYNNVSAGLNKYFSLKRGYTLKGNEYGSIKRSLMKLSINDMIDFYYTNIALLDEIILLSAQLYTRFKYFKRSDYIAYITLLIIDKNHNPYKVYNFFKQLSYGGKEIENNTISILRDKLMFNETATHKMTAATRHFYIVKTWNAYIRNIEYKVLKMLESEQNIELI